MSAEVPDTKIRRKHAADPPQWWCNGVFETCGERLFIDYPEPKP